MKKVSWWSVTAFYACMVMFFVNVVLFGIANHSPDPGARQRAMLALLTMAMCGVGGWIQWYRLGPGR